MLRFDWTIIALIDKELNQKEKWNILPFGYVRLIAMPILIQNFLKEYRTLFTAWVNRRKSLRINSLTA